MPHVKKRKKVLRRTYYLLHISVTCGTNTPSYPTTHTWYLLGIMAFVEPVSLVVSSLIGQKGKGKKSKGEKATVLPRKKVAAKNVTERVCQGAKVIPPYKILRGKLYFCD